MSLSIEEVIQEVEKSVRRTAITMFLAGMMVGAVLCVWLHL